MCGNRISMCGAHKEIAKSAQNSMIIESSISITPGIIVRFVTKILVYKVMYGYNS